MHGRAFTKGCSSTGHSFLNSPLIASPLLDLQSPVGGHVVTEGSVAIGYLLGTLGQLADVMPQSPRADHLLVKGPPVQ